MSEEYVKDANPYPMNKADENTRTTDLHDSEKVHLRQWFQAHQKNPDRIHKTKAMYWYTPPSKDLNGQKIEDSRNSLFFIDGNTNPIETLKYHEIYEKNI